MADFTLTAEPFLGRFEQHYDDVTLREIYDVAVVSAAIPLRKLTAAKKAVSAAFGVDLPEVGMSALSQDSDMRILRLGTDQAFVVFPRAQHDTGAEPHVADLLGGVFYTTDQSDVWVTLEISGTGARRALERICPLNIAPAAFGIGATARTSMEHLGTIIIRNGEDSFLLMSASSSAHSFLHAIETSIANTA